MNYFLIFSYFSFSFVCFLEFKFQSLSTLQHRSGVTDTKNLGSVDHYFDDDRIKKTPGSPNNRNFTYLVLGGGRLLWASGARLAVMTVSLFSFLFF